MTLVSFDVSFGFDQTCRWYNIDECDMLANNVLYYSMCYMHYVDNVFVQLSGGSENIHIYMF